MTTRAKINYGIIISVIGVVVMFAGGVFKAGGFYSEAVLVSNELPDFKKSVDSKFEKLFSQVEKLTYIVNNLSKDNEIRSNEERLQRQEMIKQNAELIKAIAEKKK